MQENFKELHEAERKIDSKGRIVIPAEIRKSMNLKTGDSLWIQKDNKMILFYIEE